MSERLSGRVAESMFLNLLPAQVLTILIFNLNSLFNSLIVGNFSGSESLAVFGFISPLVAFHTMIIGGITSGSQFLCERYIGRGKHEKIGEICAAVIVISFCVGMILTLIYEFLSMPIASLLGAFGNSRILVSDYLRGYGWGMIPLLFSSSVIPFLKLNNDGYVTSVSVFAMLVVNCAGTLLNTFVTKRGMFGYGAVYSLAYSVFTLIVVIYYLSGKCPTRLNFRSFNRSYAKNISALGFPAMLLPLCLSLRNLIFNNVAVRISGTKAITATAILINITVFFEMFTGGIKNTVSICTGIFYDERDKKSMLEVTPIGLHFGALIHSAAYIFIFFYSRVLARLFGSENEIVPFVANALRIAPVFLLTDVAYNIITGVYKGVGRTDFINLLTIINTLIVPIPVCLVLSVLIGIDGIWISYFAGEIITVPFALFYCGKKQKHFPFKLTEWVYIPETFGISEENRLDTSIRTKADASEVSQRIVDFCQKKDFNRRMSLYCGLCVEEISVAILEHGYEELDGKIKKKEIDVRIIYESD
ncbi:MAG: hypothetical protein MJ052_05510, partial [Sphaerochaetaceae bacterium]|nr:hypothetical protein [Sphaerochaetaceae bacterium]